MSNNNVLNYQEHATQAGDNKFVFGGSIETAGAQSLKKVYLSVDMTDVSNPSTVYLPSPVAGTITKITTILGGPITLANSVITSKIGATTITNGAVTVAFSGSAAGDVDTATPTALNTVAVGSNINFTTDGASSTTARVTIVVEITLS